MVGMLLLNAKGTSYRNSKILIDSANKERFFIHFKKKNLFVIFNKERFLLI